MTEKKYAKLLEFGINMGSTEYQKWWSLDD